MRTDSRRFAVIERLHGVARSHFIRRFHAALAPSALLLLGVGCRVSATPETLPFGAGAAGDGVLASAADDDSAPSGGAPPSRDFAPSGATPHGTAAGCDAQSISFDDLQSGEVRSDVKVRLEATATSQKFLLSHARSGSCLFGAFAGSDPSHSGPRGILVVSYGTDAPAGEPCPTGTDAIPDALTPGDAVTASGYLSDYAPSGCSVAGSPQLLVDASCALAGTTRRAVPAAYDLSFEEADALARGTDQALVRRFANGLVRLRDVDAALPASGGTGSVGPYGVIQLEQTALELHDSLEYADLSLGGPGDAAKSLVFAYPTRFGSVTGLVSLDYCTWSLAPRSRCADLAPASANCP
jgi:hypothetical protein